MPRPSGGELDRPAYGPSWLRSGSTNLDSMSFHSTIRIAADADGCDVLERALLRADLADLLAGFWSWRSWKFSLS